MLMKRTIDFLKNIYQSGSDTMDKSSASSPWFLSFWIAESTAFLYESAATPLGKIFPLQTHWFKNLDSLQIDREKKRRNKKNEGKNGQTKVQIPSLNHQYIVQYHQKTMSRLSSKNSGGLKETIRNIKEIGRNTKITSIKIRNPNLRS